MVNELSTQFSQVSPASKLLVHTQRYNTDLRSFGIDKPFALDRGERVLQELSKSFGCQFRPVCPSPISHEQALLVHTPEYLQSLQNPQVWFEIFELKPEEYNPSIATRPLNELWDDIALKSGGTLEAARIALEHGFAANLGGGYHHAFPDQGRGFCVLHDVGIAVRQLQKEKRIKRCLIVDTDFHQGDGTAVIFGQDPDVLTLSIHSEEGWPDEKQISDIDVPIRESETHLYLHKLKTAIYQALEQFDPHLVMNIAGSDPYEKDVLPGTRFLKLSLEEMKRRDALVIETFAQRGIPIASVFAGGYGDDVWEVHYWATRCLLENWDSTSKIKAL